MPFTEALLKLTYYEPGEDLNKYISENKDGIVNVKATLNSLIKLLKKSISKLEKINKIIPNDTTLDIYGSGHNIGMSGDNEIIEKLLAKGLVEEGEFVEESFDEEDEEDEEEEEEDDDDDEDYDEEDYSQVMDQIDVISIE